jgi:hypothetical protein
MTVSNPGAKNKMALPKRKHTPKKKKSSNMVRPPTKRVKIRGNPGNKRAPKGMTQKEKDQYIKYKVEFEKKPKAELESYLERNRGSKSVRYKAARAVMNSYKRLGGKQKAHAAYKKAKAKAKPKKKTTAKKKTTKKVATKKTTTRSKKAVADKKMTTAEKLRPDKNGKYQWSRVSDARLLAYLKKCAKKGRCSTKKYASARAAARNRKSITKSALKEIPAVGRSSYGSGRTKVKKKTTKKVAAKKKTTTKKKTTQKKKVTATKHYNTSGVSNAELMKQLRSSIESGRTYTIKYKAFKREYNKRKKARTLADNQIEIIEKMLGSPEHKKKRKAHQKAVRKGKAKTYKQRVAATKKKRSSKRASPPLMVRYGMKVNGIWNPAAIMAGLKDLDARLSGAKKGKRSEREKKFHQAARDAARRSGRSNLISMIQSINAKHGKNYKTSKLPDSVLKQNPFANPGFEIISPAGIATIVAGNMASKAFRGLIDYTLMKIEEKDKTSTVRTNWGLAIRAFVPLAVGVGLVSFGTTPMMLSLGGGMLSDSIPFVVRTIASTMSKEAPRWVGGPVANRMDLKEPTKLFPGISASATEDQKNEQAGANTKGFLSRGEATHMAQQAAWQPVREVGGYQPAGVLSAYRSPGYESLDACSYGGTVGKAVALIRTNRRRRLMAGYMGG